ncbi:MAG: hypothetical protein ACI30R_11095 [Sodaliphilus sp.]
MKQRKKSASPKKNTAGGGFAAGLRGMMGGRGAIGGIAPIDSIAAIDLYMVCNGIVGMGAFGILKERVVVRCFLCCLFLCYNYFYYLCTRKRNIILTKVEKFGCLQPLKKMLKLRIIPLTFTALLAFFRH